MPKRLAINGGKPVREKMLPYGHQWIDDEDIAAVIDILRSDWITTGPKVSEFEHEFAEFTGSKEAVVVSSGTAALHAAMYALGIKPKDEVIVSPMTFAASANCILFQGGTPVFSDVDAGTLLLDTSKINSRVTPRTKAIIAVDYAGHPCNYDSLRELADENELKLVADSCHALGASYKGRKTGSLADLNIFSLHPVKHITTGEGGVITTDDPELARKMRIFRNHGISSDHRQREMEGSWYYEMVDLGYNYRLTDFQCALGISQLRKLPGWIKRRQQIAECYDKAFQNSSTINPLEKNLDVVHAYHLYVVRINTELLKATRAEIFSALRAEGIGVNVHYIPVHLHPFYRQKFGTGPGLCPIAEQSYEQIISLPIFPKMSNDDVGDVVNAVFKVTEAFTS
jgi:perosamine synthetase